MIVVTIQDKNFTFLFPLPKVVALTIPIFQTISPLVLALLIFYFHLRFIILLIQDFSSNSLIQIFFIGSFL